MKIAVIGVGCIGSVIATYFAEAGHEVVLVARGQRGETLRQQGLSVRPNSSQSGRTLSLHVVETLAEVADAEWVLVTVQMQQVDALIPALQTHKAEQIVFLLNAHPIPPSWVAALGERLILGFPAMLAVYQENEVVFTTLPAWLKFAIITTLGTLPGQDPSAARNVVKQLRSVGLAPAQSIAAVFWMLTRLPYFQKAVTAYAEHGRDEMQAMYNGLRSEVEMPNCPNLDNLCLS